MSAPYFVRVRLRRDVAAVAIAGLLVPSDPNARMGASHRLIWALFGDAPDRKRDFLWREIGPGEYLALSMRRPVDEHKLFHLEHKPFAPAINVGQRLGFSLRVNPVVAEKSPGRRGKRQDVVMRAMYPLSAEERATRRPAVMQEALGTWLQRQGERNGFVADLSRLRLEGYDQVRLTREKQEGQSRADPIRFSVVTMEGVLTVADPAAFLARLTQGFGAAKAFGCGLMLIRAAADAQAA